MDLSKFKERYPVFLKLMKEKGYYGRYIEKYEGMVRLILKECGDDSIRTYEQFYHHMVEHHNYTERTCYEYRSLIGRLKVFVEEGVFLGDSGKKSGFLRYKSYDFLSPEFKSLIDNYLEIEQKQRELKESTVKPIASCTSAFFLCLQQAGITTLSGIKNPQIVLHAFGESQNRHGSYSVSRAVSTVLKTCSHLYPDGECDRVFGMIPEFPNRTRIYDYLQPEESERIAFALDDDQNKLTYRCKAIGKLAFYTGMRRVDIAGLRFENISLEKEEITLEQQKTGMTFYIPLRPIVGNAIRDYVVNERPKCTSDYIFITAVAPFIKLSPAGVSNDCESIFREIDLRQKRGRRRGLHIFRHAFATGLIARDTSFHVVSELLGHTSPTSLNPYLDADIEHLRECALSILPFSETRNACIEPFCSPVREKMRKYVDHCIDQGIWCSDYHNALRSFDIFCVTVYPDELDVSQEIFNQWNKPITGESCKAYLKRINAMADIVSFSLPAITMPEPENVGKRKKSSLLKEFTGAGAGLLNQFVSHRIASGRWSVAYDWALRSFDMHCATLYPEATRLTQEMVDTWCALRPTENLHSCGKRTAVVRSFLEYARSRRLLNLDGNSVPTHGRGSMTLKNPHVFTETELENFFFACDAIHIRRNSLVDRLMQLTVPVFFRLLYSSGIRTNEARNLDVEDVDLKQGIINIRQTKGHVEHRVALHPTMTEQLVAYHTAVNKLKPDRKCFFPNYYDRYYSLVWMENHFERLWSKYNHHHATPCHLRHHYATTNINNWPARTEKFNRNLLYLSRSMGHSTIETTMYYYSFTPKLAELLKAHKHETFNEIIPNRYQYFTEDED